MDRPCRPWIEAALKYAGGTHDYGDIVRSVMEGTMQLWPASHSAAVTEIVVYPKMKTLHVFLAGGRKGQLIEMIDSAAEWGKAQGCTSMTMAGRKGWERVLGSEGWRPAMSVMERPIV